MNPETRMDDSSHTEQLRVLRRMTPEERLVAALTLSEFTRNLFAEGLRRRFPSLPDREFTALLRARLDLCHNRRS
jgi:hypothetical protein